MTGTLHARTWRCGVEEQRHGGHDPYTTGLRAGRTGNRPLTRADARAPPPPSDAPLTASHMRSTGAGSPVHSSSWAAAWCTSIPRPSTVGRTRAGRSGEPRRRPRGIDEIGHHLARDGATTGARATPRPAAPAPAMPTGVALTTRSACATSASSSARSPTRPTGPARAATRAARAAVRFTHRQVGAAGAGQSHRDRPGGPSGTDDQAALPGGIEARPREPARPGTRRRRCSPPAASRPG